MARIGATKIYAELAAKGMTATQIAEQAGVHYTSVINWARRYGVTLQKGYGRDPRIIERNKKMANMYVQGCTLESIGKQFGLTRERVRQILSKKGVTANDGGAKVRAELRAAQKVARREAESLRKYGLPYDLMCELHEQKLPHAFDRQRRNAEQRAVGWNLTFAEWFSVWQASGKLHLRGRGKGKYVMSRILDDGPYALGNVHIQPAVDNSREATAKWRGKVKENRGVYLLYPGRAQPWCARVGRVSLGFFATQEEAVAAREKYFSENPDARRTGRGYAITGTKDRPRYQVMVGRKYVGSFKTPEEALEARARYIEELERQAREAAHA